MLRFTLGVLSGVVLSGLIALAWSSRTASEANGKRSAESAAAQPVDSSHPTTVNTDPHFDAKLDRILGELEALAGMREDALSGSTANRTASPSVTEIPSADGGAKLVDILTKLDDIKSALAMGGWTGRAPTADELANAGPTNWQAVEAFISRLRADPTTARNEVLYKRFSELFMTWGRPSVIGERSVWYMRTAPNGVSDVQLRLSCIDDYISNVTNDRP